MSAIALDFEKETLRNLAGPELFMQTGLERMDVDGLEDVNGGGWILAALGAIGSAIGSAVASAIGSAISSAAVSSPASASTSAAASAVGSAAGSAVASGVAGYSNGGIF